MHMNLARATFALALLAVVGVGSYAMADSGQKQLKADGLERLSGEPGHLDRGGRQLRGNARRRSSDAHVRAQLLRARGHRPAGAHPLRQARRQRRHHGLPLRDSGVPGPAGTPACPQEGTVSRTVGAADILGARDTGHRGGNFEELAAALRSGHAYANVHSSKWPGGEIRAQINDPNDN